MRGPSYVAAAFLLVACAPQGDEEPTAAQMQEARAARGTPGGRICSWNIRRLGHNFDNRAKDLEGTAKIIDDLCDVTVVQEVMQTTGGGSEGYTELLTQLGADWGGMVAERPRPDTTAASAEHYAFYYRKSAAGPCTSWGNAVKYLPDEEDAFLREPAWSCIKLRTHSRELLLASYHAVFGSPADRRREVGWIDDDLDFDGQRDDVFRTIKKSRPGADVLMLGDFNLKPNELADVLPTYKDLTRGSGSTINESDDITDNLYDHVIVPAGDPLATMAPAEVLDVRDYATKDTYFRSISDHLPIRFTLTGAEPPPPPPPPPEGPYGAGSAAPLDNGESPSAEFAIKGNKQSMLYHTLDSPYFKSTKAEVWFHTTQDAERAGFKRWRPL